MLNDRNRSQSNHHCGPVTKFLPTESDFLKANLRVFSNAKNHRTDSLVPLVVPTVNLNHLDILKHQRTTYGLDKGFIVCNSNCAVVALVVPLAALQEKFGPIECCSVVTLQAVRLSSPMPLFQIRHFRNPTPFFPSRTLSPHSARYCVCLPNPNHTDLRWRLPWRLINGHP